MNQLNYGTKVLQQQFLYNPHVNFELLHPSHFCLFRHFQRNSRRAALLSLAHIHKSNSKSSVHRNSNSIHNLNEYHHFTSYLDGIPNIEKLCPYLGQKSTLGSVCTGLATMSFSLSPVSSSNDIMSCKHFNYRDMIF